LPQLADLSLTALIQEGRLSFFWEWPKGDGADAVEQLAEQFEQILETAAGLATRPLKFKPPKPAKPAKSAKPTKLTGSTKRPPQAARSERDASAEPAELSEPAELPGLKRRPAK
ncbi:MAG: hypothetical protein LBJ64_08610, partial [Deltaproteobacteria bacterium]|jgi:hypothetical protein|nr:hypothetical protein [Deltaproteobacteria bacterium]